MTDPELIDFLTAHSNSSRAAARGMETHAHGYAVEMRKAAMMKAAADRIAGRAIQIGGE